MPGDYVYAENSWGNSFYKIHEAKNYNTAKTQCESDGAYLAVPRSDAENAFIAGLIPDEKIWIGVNDIDEEGTFIAVDGTDVSYTKFPWWQPDNFLHKDGLDEDGVLILPNENWNDEKITNQYKFVCLYNILD